MKKKLDINLEELTVPNDIAETKRNLREIAQKARMELAAEERSAQDEVIRQRLKSLKEYKEADVFLCYFSNKFEVGTRKIIEQAWEDNKIVAIPKRNKEDHTLKFYSINSYQDIKTDENGFGEPPETKEIEGGENSICIVPGLLFDYRGRRIGYGEGCYDRFLEQYKGCKVGIAYSLFMIRILPKEKFDQTLDYMITEKFTKKVGKPQLV